MEGQKPSANDAHCPCITVLLPELLACGNRLISARSEVQLLSGPYLQVHAPSRDTLAAAHCCSGDAIRGCHLVVPISLQVPVTQHLPSPCSGGLTPSTLDASQMRSDWPSLSCAARQTTLACFISTSNDRNTRMLRILSPLLRQWRWRQRARRCGGHASAPRDIFHRSGKGTFQLNVDASARHLTERWRKNMVAPPRSRPNPPLTHAALTLNKARRSFRVYAVARAF